MTSNAAKVHKHHTVDTEIASHALADADQRKIELEAQDADVIGKLLRQEREVVSLVTSIAQSRRHLASCEQEVDKLRAEHDQFSTQIAALESTIEVCSLHVT